MFNTRVGQVALVRLIRGIGQVMLVRCVRGVGQVMLVRFICLIQE